MTCKRSDTCIHGTICSFARSMDYALLGGSCYIPTNIELTNEEYIRTCTTKELEELLCCIATECHWNGYFKGKDDEDYDNEYCLINKNIMQWLKEIHHA